MTTTPDGGSAAPSPSGSPKRVIIARAVLLIFGIGCVILAQSLAKSSASDLGQARAAAVAMSSIDRVAPALEGKLVLASGHATSTQGAVDPVFGVTVPPPVLAVRRRVEYFQWRESRKGDKDYSYDTEWVNEPIDSLQFHQTLGHDNTVRLPPSLANQLQDNVVYSAPVDFGAYRLPDFLIEELSKESKLRKRFVPSFTDEQMAELRRVMHSDPSVGAAIGQAIAGKVAGAVTETLGSGAGGIVRNVLEGRGAELRDGYLFLGDNYMRPKPGEVRVYWQAVSPSDVTILAQVAGNTFQPYTTASGQKFSEVAVGQASMDEMFKQAAASNTLVIWLLRIFGVAIMLPFIYSIATRKRAAKA